MRGLALVILSLVACAAGPAVATDYFAGKTFRVLGPWSGTGIRAERIQLREPDTESDKVQVTGRVALVAGDPDRIRIGPVEVTLEPRTRWRDITRAALAEGALVRVSGTAAGPASMIAQRVEAGPRRPWGHQDIEITATMQAAPGAARPGDADGWTMLGIPVDTRGAGYNRVESLTRRADSRRPEFPTIVPFLDRPLRITGEYDATLRDRRNYKLDDSTNPNIRDDVTHEFQLEFFLPYTDDVYFFAELKAFYEDEFRRTDGEGESAASIARGLAWAYVNGFLDGRLGFQAGRQNVREYREWWWDADLDAIRMYVDEGPVHAELGIAHELARVSSLQSGVAPEAQGLYRGFATVSWLWASRQTVEFFALGQRDRSSAPAVGTFVADRDQDEDDANLAWFGLRAIGQRSLGDFGALRYWADLAWVRGEARTFGFDDDGTVDLRRDARVRGSAVDVGASWRTKLPGEPWFTAGFASGSGDANTADGTDGGFRQTGLHKNKGKFFGAKRFRYYGEVLRPELSNLRLITLGAGLPVLGNSSIDLVYHRYWQSVASTAMRDIRIDADLTGQSRDLGQELDVILAFRDAPQVDVILTAGVFRAGQAYGALAGKTARLLNVDFVFFF